MDSERLCKLSDVCEKSHEVSVDSQRLSKLACAFEESLRISSDSDKSERSSRNSVDSERPDNPRNTHKTSLDVSIMERCLAAMTQSSSRSSSQEPEAHDKHVADEDDDDDCSSLLASLSDLQTQLQQEIRQARYLHDVSDKHGTTCELKSGVESTSDSKTGVEHFSRSGLEDTMTSVCKSEDRATNNTSTTTTTTAAATSTTASSLPVATTTKSAARVTASTTGCCCLFSLHVMLVINQAVGCHHFLLGPRLPSQL